MYCISVTSWSLLISLLFYLIVVAFRIYDIDRDGYISNGELFQVLKMMVGTNLKDAQLQQIVDKTIINADTDGDGKVSFEEFCMVIWLTVFHTFSNNNAQESIEPDDVLAMPWVPAGSWSSSNEKAWALAFKRQLISLNFWSRSFI